MSADRDEARAHDPLPKLDVAGSSPVARSRNIVGIVGLRRAGILVGPGAFALGPTGTDACILRQAAKRTRCSTVSRSTRRLRSTRLAASGSSALWVRDGLRRRGVGRR